MDAIFELSFLLNQAISLTALCLIQYTNGYLAEHKNVKVNYTRKINHFTLFVIPILLNRGYAYDQSFGLFALGAFLAVFKFIFYIKPIRDRVPFIRTMFSSFDRPEDRPHTLLWLSTQTAAGYLVLIPMGILFSQLGLMELILIPILIYGIGDGLAEPVGVRFGKHKYAAYALFSDKKYFRTFEGSACVLITSIIVVIAHYTFFTPLQLMVALAAIPILMTLAEAFSPHTWDSPVMFLVGSLSLLAISFI
ncbi:diacylglycerol/polyprenol kinase family protein [Dethiobacter alkaliphilus]|uniref:Phosphatidate cytidylyltransferase n=1 Tax=Dethiobacter alkaliphilus AHT 1 TaxID=555088 RepID=C0GGK9_DETAL|nr:hypothetical protein [Dethiobacter alkaliphilus]EEG77450.1 hypothetical protein DealDRAFT_1573 [Dethiobacter alkaliphilus AHT 1]